MTTNKKSSSTSGDKPGSGESGNKKYKYHQSQINGDTENKSEYPDKPHNHTTTDERLLDPDRGESE